MRVFVAASAEELRALSEQDAALPGDRFVPASEDEQDEFEAMQAAADVADAVVAAELDDRDEPVRLEQVRAWHVDPDGSGDLAWFATQELPEVLVLLDA